MSKFGIVLAVVLSCGIATANAQIQWSPSQWEAYAPATRFAQADTEVSGKTLVITPNWTDGKLATALHNSVAMTYAPKESMIIFKVETEGISFSDLKGAQVEMVHAFKENAPEGEANFYTDKVGCTKTTKNGEGDNIGYFYVNLADNLAKKGANLTSDVILNGNTNWKDNQRSWIAFMIEAAQLPTVSGYKVNVIGLCSAEPAQFVKADGSLSAGMIRDYINNYTAGISTSINDIQNETDIDLQVYGNCVTCGTVATLTAFSATGIKVAESTEGQLILSFPPESISSLLRAKMG